MTGRGGAVAAVGLLTELTRTTLTALLDLSRTRAFRRTAALLGAGVATLFGLHLLQSALGGGEASALRDFAIDRDGSLSERFEYALSVAAALLLLRCFQLRGATVFLSLALVHVWLLVDNALHGHEKLGWEIKLLMDRVGGPSVGESVVFLVVMATAALLVGQSLRRAEGADRAAGLALAAIAGSLAVFAVGVDLAHAKLRYVSPELDWSLALIEDGGELIIFALNAAFAAAAWSRLRRPAAAPAFTTLPRAPAG